MNFKMLFRQNKSFPIGVLAWIVIFLISCQEDLQFDTPKLDEPTMVKVLKDVHLAEAWLATLQNYPEAKRDSIAHLQYQTIFKLHNVDPKDYEQSMQAYSRNPAAMTQLYEKVLEHLNREEVKVTHPNAKQKATAPKQDTIQPTKDTVVTVPKNSLVPHMPGTVVRKQQ